MTIPKNDILFFLRALNLKTQASNFNEIYKLGYSDALLDLADSIGASEEYLTYSKRDNQQLKGDE